DAFIDNSANVNANNDVLVTAEGKDTIVSVAVAVGGGVVGVAGAVSVIVLNTHTFADTGTRVNIDAGNNVLMSSSDDTKVIVVAGGVAGGFVGVGVGVGVTSVTKATQAYIGANSTVDAGAHGASLDSDVYTGSITNGAFATTGGFHGVAVQAAS